MTAHASGGVTGENKPGDAGEDAATFLSPDVLNRAADIMQERGLAKGLYFEDDGRCCILGAVALARGYALSDLHEGGKDWMDGRIEEPLCDLSVLMGHDAVNFSDEPGIGTEDVAQALRNAAYRMVVVGSFPARVSGFLEGTT